MSLWLYHLISGGAYFTGNGLIIAALLIAGYRQHTGRIVAGCLLALGGFALSVLSSTPSPPWLYGVGVVALVVWISSLVRASTSSAVRRFASLWLLSAALLAVFLELPYHVQPRLPAGKFEKAYVIGDSISAGIGPNINTWPVLLQKQHGVAVANLAVAGADLHSARLQADRLEETRALVLIEIGGNDLLENKPAREFESDLNRLLAAVCRPERTVVMLELPLLPLQNAYGAAQRRQARKFGVSLIPRRCFAAVLRQKDSTIDGLHLSAAGHERMAEMIWKVIGSCLSSTSPASHG